MKINISTKYTYIFNDEGEKIQYFESFEEKGKFKRVQKICTQDNKGRRFLIQNEGKIIDAKVILFGKRIKRKGMFIREKEGAFSYLILI